MHGVPKDLPLERLVGQEFNFIGLGRHQIQFHISGLVAIHVGGGWELWDHFGSMVDGQQDHEERDAYRLHRVIDEVIVSFQIDAPESFTLLFDTGDRLTIYDDLKKHVSFSLHFAGEPSIDV